MRLCGHKHPDKDITCTRMEHCDSEAHASFIEWGEWSPQPPPSLMDRIVGLVWRVLR